MVSFGYSVDCVKGGIVCHPLALLLLHFHEARISLALSGRYTRCVFFSWHMSTEFCCLFLCTGVFHLAVLLSGWLQLSTGAIIINGRLLCVVLLPFSVVVISIDTQLFVVLSPFVVVILIDT